MRRSTVAAMTCLSDDEWAEMDRRARTAYRLFVLARRAALFAAATFVMTALMWLVARNAQPRHYDAWGETCSGYLHKHTNGE